MSDLLVFPRGGSFITCFTNISYPETTDATENIKVDEINIIMALYSTLSLWEQLFSSPGPAVSSHFLLEIIVN